jgi:hypothetical protein
MGEINVTSDSSPGWIPTAEQRRRAVKTTQAYLDAIDDGRYAEAYGLQADALKRAEVAVGPPRSNSRRCK